MWLTYYIVSDPLSASFLLLLFHFLSPGLKLCSPWRAVCLSLSPCPQHLHLMRWWTAPGWAELVVWQCLQVPRNQRSLTEGGRSEKVLALVYLPPSRPAGMVSTNNNKGKPQRKRFLKQPQKLKWHKKGVFDNLQIRIYFNEDTMGPISDDRAGKGIYNV